MTNLNGRRIVLAVTGGVAAYKSAFLCRRLIEAGAEVRVVMTDEAVNFIGPTTFASLTGKPVIRSLFSSDLVSPHTDLGRWADAVVVAPATAATLARLVSGLSEEPVSATLLATRAPVLLAPAMHTEMWEHPATTPQHHPASRRTGTISSDRPAGHLAGGDEGIGRMAEPEEIVAALDELFGGTIAVVGSLRREGAGDRRRHPRGDRSGSIHRQPLIGKDGACHRRRSRSPRRRGRPGHDAPTARAIRR